MGDSWIILFLFYSILFYFVYVEFDWNILITTKSEHCFLRCPIQLSKTTCAQSIRYNLEDRWLLVKMNSKYPSKLVIIWVLVTLTWDEPMSSLSPWHHGTSYAHTHTCKFTHARTFHLKDTLTCTLLLRTRITHTLLTQSDTVPNTHIPAHTGTHTHALGVQQANKCRSVLPLLSALCRMKRSLPSQPFIFSPCSSSEAKCIQPSHLDSWDFGSFFLPFKFRLLIPLSENLSVVHSHQMSLLRLFRPECLIFFTSVCLAGCWVSFELRWHQIKVNKDAAERQHFCLLLGFIQSRISHHGKALYYLFF